MITEPRHHLPYIEADGARWNYWQSQLENAQTASDFIRYQIILRLLPPPPATVVDVGCGDGYLSHLLQQTGYNPIALDLSLRRLEKARHAAGDGLNVVQASCYSPPLKSLFCGAVIYSEILEHLEDPSAALASGVAMLKEGGLCIVSVPHAQDAPLVVCPSCLTRFNAAGHLHHFTEDQLGHLVEGQGLAVERIFSGVSALTRYLLRRRRSLSSAAVLLDRCMRRAAPADNLYLFLVARRRSNQRCAGSACP